ncbi:MAG: beta-glucuronidase [Cytophagaceae bacterium]|nr:beta-glucuronidase [Cytophagaceae bacterium]
MRIVFVFFLLVSFSAGAQYASLVHNPEGRNKISLNGQWQIIVDPYENGFYNYRYQEKTDGYFLNEKPKTKTHLIEYDFDKSETLNVPGDWNSQKEKLLLYEGTVWYKKSFDYPKKNGVRTFLYFGAANYEAYVYLNGKKIGKHEGGFTPFNFEVTGMLNEKDNFVVAKIDDKRKRDGIPTVNTDWWNYGGLTRDVYLLEVPETFIQDYFIQLKDGSMKDVEGWIQLDGSKKSDAVKLSIPEAKFETVFKTDESGKVKIAFSKQLQLWSPENPKLYKVILSTSTDTIIDMIGFRSIETQGQNILLNGKSVFLKGVCIHEEAPQRGSRANGIDDAKQLLSWAKELGCNYVRLAHYPHNEWMVRMADQMGLMVWSEIPVYWTIQYENDTVFANAKNQLTEMITRDKNRASVIIWSMANETPVKESRNIFIGKLATQARTLDPTRLISAALEIHRTDGNTMMLDDPLGQYLDVLGCNEYIGWYGGTAESCSAKVWKTIYDKPLVMSEFGAEALYNHHGGADEIWTEEYQEHFYKCQVYMLKNISFLRGSTPWIMVDFRSPRRHLPNIQDGYNRKGLISDKGFKKKAWYVMKKFYEEK